MMDVSDGLAWDLFRLCRASGVMATLTAVPVHRDAERAARSDGETALSHALHDGEDHELIATMTARDAAAALADSSSALSDLCLIGVISEGKGLMISSQLTGAGDRMWSPGDGGWRHGG